MANSLDMLWHNPTTRIVHGTGHRVIDFFKRIYLSTTLKPYKLQLDTLTSIGPYFRKTEDKFICPVPSNLVGPLVNQTLGCLSNDDFWLTMENIFFVDRFWVAYERYQTSNFLGTWIWSIAFNFHVYPHVFVISDTLVHKYEETILGHFMHTKTPPAYRSVLVLLYRCQHFRKHGYRHNKITFQPNYFWNLSYVTLSSLNMQI